ncbi:MAG: terminase small subunit [Calditrichia bacterium]
MASLTAKQKRFCEEYILDFNTKAAAERAGYSLLCLIELLPL